MSQIKEDRVIEILKQCYDPELPVDLWNLGLIYDIQIQEAYDETKSDINIIMSLTTCLLYTSPSPRDLSTTRRPSYA